MMTEHDVTTGSGAWFAGCTPHAILMQFSGLSFQPCNTADINMINGADGLCSQLGAGRDDDDDDDDIDDDATTELGARRLHTA